MINWSEHMQQTFEYYIVDPGTWENNKRLDNITSSTIEYDDTAETLGSASIDTTEVIGECYIRIYLVCIQNKRTYKFCLGTFLAQTPSFNFNGKYKSVSMQAYTPLIELKEKMMPIGYNINKDENILDKAYRITRDNVRAPVIFNKSDITLKSDFVSNIEDTVLRFLIDLLRNADYEFYLDNESRILFSPRQDVKTMQPVWTYNDDNSSILLPDISFNHDIYGIPNVVDIVYSRDKKTIHSTIKNEDPNSLTSIQNRGREIIYRETEPKFHGEPTQRQLDEYAKKILIERSSIEYIIAYKHGYCPVRVGDCVMINYNRAGLKDIKAKVISQSISCKPGCEVNEKAKFTAKLWGGDNI